jgi:hypothetical protein
MTERFHHEDHFKYHNNGRDIISGLIEVTTKLVLKLADDIRDRVHPAFDSWFDRSAFTAKVPLDYEGYYNLA